VTFVLLDVAIHGVGKRMPELLELLRGPRPIVNKAVPLTGFEDRVERVIPIAQRLDQHSCIVTLLNARLLIADEGE